VNNFPRAKFDGVAIGGKFVMDFEPSDKVDRISFIKFIVFPGKKNIDQEFSIKQ